MTISSIFTTLTRAPKFEEDLNVRRCPPFITLVVFFIFIVLKELPLAIYELIETKDFTLNTNDLSGLSLVHFLIVFIGFVCLVCHTALRIRKQLRTQDPTFQTLDVSHCLQLGVCVTFAAAAILDLFHKVIHKHEHLQYPLFVGLAKSENVFTSPGSHIVFTTYTVTNMPLLVSAVYYDALRDLAWIWWLACGVSLIIVCSILEDDVYTFISVFSFFQAFLIYAAVVHNTWIEYVKDELRQRNQREEILRHDVNMKLMLANAAHDLKTPLASLIGGLEVVRGYLSTLQNVTNSVVASATCGDSQALTSLEMSSPSPHDQQAALMSVQTLVNSSLMCMQDMMSTNHFMIMGINQCIHYTKSSSGLQLIPVYEHVNIRDAISLPLRVMRDIQSQEQNIRIEMQPMSEEISSFIVTDQQWLQENVLCLLSNAVKYSLQGKIELRIVLVDARGSGIADTTEDLRAVSLVKHDETASHVAKKPRTSWLCVGGNAVPSLSTFCGIPTSRVQDESNTHHIHPPANTGIAKNNTSVSRFITPPHQSTQSSHPQLYLRVEVEDEGIGMTDEQRSKLFAPFSQNQNFAAGSTGLGLYSLKKRVEALGGGVGVKGRRDGRVGSLFWFTLPYTQNEQHEHLLKQVVEEGGKEGDGNAYRSVLVDRYGSISWSRDGMSNCGGLLSKRSVDSHLSTQWAPYFPQPLTPPIAMLVVDDSPTILRMTTRLLEREGVGVGVAQNGAIALEKIRGRWGEGKLTYDCILMDLHMPVMDGLEAVRRLRIMEKEQLQHGVMEVRHIVIALSAAVDENLLSAIEQAGFDACLSKPIQTVDLFETLMRLRRGNA